MFAALLAPLFLAQPPLEVVGAKPRPDLAAAFVRTSGWTGSDCAYSIPLSPTRTLWLFGDTWIGEIAGGRRVNPRMINNTAAWQELGDPAPRFFWNDTAKEPASLLRPDEPMHWYWPGDGTMIRGKLYLFMHVVKHKEEGAPGFQFEWVADDLLRIDNPNDVPTKWKFARRRLGPELNLGTACIADGDYLYAYGLTTGKRKPLTAPLCVARIHRDRLAELDLDAIESWRDGKWQPGLIGATPVLHDGASEMSVQKLRGIEGFIAVYMPLGLSRDIVVRRALKPEGPWGEATNVYRCPKEAKDVFVYAAKGHAELAEKDGQLIITYCRNVGALGEHVKRPEIYAPQVVEVLLKK